MFNYSPLKFDRRNDEKEATSLLEDDFEVTMRTLFAHGNKEFTSYSSTFTLGDALFVFVMFVYIIWI